MYLYLQYVPSMATSSMSELFELLDRLQSSRLDDQRCEMPSLSRRSPAGNEDVIRYF